MSTQANEMIVRQWIEVGCNNGDVSMVDTHYAPDYVGYAPGQDIVGAEALKQFIRVWHAGFPDFHMAVEDLIAAGDQVVWRFSVTGTHRGTLFDVPATSRPVSFTGIVITRFVNGMWAEDYIQIDLLGILQQLGAIPVPVH